MPDIMPIALLSQAGESGRHLREALADCGTPIVYESQAAEFDREALEKSGARVVVVNLDPEVEAHLDDVYALLDDDRYNVIFDESQVSSQLAGWEQARWARHLAAKILGTENADPPRPEGAEPVPQRIPSAALEPIAEEGPLPESDSAAEVDEQSVDAAELAERESPALESSAIELADTGTAEPEDAAEEFAGIEPVESEHAEVDSATSEDGEELDDFADIAALLGEAEADPLDFVLTHAAIPAAPAPPADITVDMPALDFSEFDDFANPAESEAVEDRHELQVDHGSREFDAVEVVETSIEISSFEAPVPPDDEILGFGDLDDFAGFDDETIEVESVEEGQPVPVADDLAESSMASDAAASGGELSDLELLDLDWADTPPAPPAIQGDAEQERDELIVPEVASASAFAWSLEEVDDGSASSPVADDVPVAPAQFGIETVSAAEYLAPSDEQAADEPFQGGMSLELIPLDEAVAPRASESVAHESWLDPNTQVAISRVWVLGASIGGPEAVREFLADIPGKCPALFLLAQHMGAEFMEIMAQQLVRSTALTVRTPSHGERVGHGDILVVPTTHRLRVDRAGVVTLESLPASGQANSPSIDQVLQDVADRFGARAGAIIFSGMAEDAAEGSRYLAGIGGTVFAQDPETCVISSMVDGVIETGAVSFVGAPKALAAKLLEELNVAAKS